VTRVAVLVGEETRLVVQGLTGREGSFHGLRNREYGTRVVAGVTPGKGGSDVEGIPIFDTVDAAVQETRANTAMVFVPPRFAADAILEAYDAGVEVIVAITEGIPAMDMARCVGYLRLGESPVTLIGPNCPGVISPGKSNVGIIPGEICTPGPVGLVSRSGTLTYQIIHELTQRGIGQSSCVGIGGDPIPGADFIDILRRFENDPETEIVVFVGEIGGDAEERAAAWAEEHMSKAVVAYIAGFTAPPGRRMGHAGAIISGSQGTAQAKAEALEAAGIRVGRNPSEVAEIVEEIHKKK
jgi:succinyl-CoA synthetase alpha subunit